MTWTFAAWGPFWPWVTSKVTRRTEARNSPAGHSSRSAESPANDKTLLGAVLGMKRSGSSLTVDCGGT